MAGLNAPGPGPAPLASWLRLPMRRGHPGARVLYAHRGSQRGNLAKRPLLKPMHAASREAAVPCLVSSAHRPLQLWAPRKTSASTRSLASGPGPWIPAGCWPARAPGRCGASRVLRRRSSPMLDDTPGAGCCGALATNRQAQRAPRCVSCWLSATQRLTAPRQPRAAATPHLPTLHAACPLPLSGTRSYLSSAQWELCARSR